MEDRLCPLHQGKQLNCFCWTCQSLVCKYCMKDHKSYNHKVYSLWATIAPMPTKQIKQKIESKPPQASPKPKPSSPIKNEHPVEKPKPVVKNQSDEPCIFCGSDVSSEGIKLKCQHWSHSECLK